jgi:hypothetical protein
MRAPDGNYAEGFTLPGQSRPPTPIPKQGEFEKNNPLSLDAEVIRPSPLSEHSRQLNSYIEPVEEVV